MLSILANYTKVGNKIIEKGFNINGRNGLLKITGYLGFALKQQQCELAEKLIDNGFDLSKIYEGGMRQNSSLFQLSYSCQNVSRKILQEVKKVKKDVMNMTVELGDELVYNLLPELGHQVVVVNWEKYQWYTYILDTQAINMFSGSTKNNTVVVMTITAPYPHPFLFMTDFRQHLLHHISNQTTHESCEARILAVPDMFTLITDGVRNVFNAVQFYAPVLESLYEGQDFRIDIYFVFTSIFVSFIMFLCLTLPLHILLHMWCKKKQTKKIPPTKIHINDNAGGTQFAREQNCHCKNAYNASGTSTSEQSEEPRCKSTCQFSWVTPVAFYLVIGFGNLFLFQFAKKTINWIGRFIINISSYNSSLWIILIFKFLNIAILENQPGSLCSGNTFAKEQNLRLAFWLSDHRDLEYQMLINRTKKLDIERKELRYKYFALTTPEVNKVTYPNISEDLKNWAEEMQLDNDKETNIVGKSKNLSQFAHHLKEQWYQKEKLLTNTLKERYETGNQLNKKNPMKIWMSNWLNKGEWIQTKPLDIAGQASSLLIHVSIILVFNNFGVFQKIDYLWICGRRHKRMVYLLIVFVAFGLNIASKLIPFPNSDNLTRLIPLRVLFLTLFTPSSVLLEWCTWKCVMRILSLWQGIFYSLYTSCTKSNLRNMTIQNHLKNFALTMKEVEYARGIVDKICTPFIHQLQKESNHQLELVPTGSVFEGYGKPLNFQQKVSHLGTDYDLMYAFRRSDLAVEFIMKDHEFLHIFSLQRNCDFLRKLEVFDEKAQAWKLSSIKAKELMRRVVNSTQKKDSVFHKSFLKSLLPFIFNTPRYSRYVSSYIT